MIDPYLKPVRLMTDRYRDNGVTAGTIGTVVEAWDDGFYEVEFSNHETGETVALLTLPRNDVEVVDRAATDRIVQAGD